MREGSLMYELSKTAVTIAAIIALGLGLWASFTVGENGQIRLALIAGIAGLGGFPLMEVLHRGVREMNGRRRRRGGRG